MHQPSTIIVLHSNIHLQMWLFFLSATSDYASTTGEVTIDSDNTRQCISILIRTDTLTESTECFSFGMTLSNTVANLTVEPDTASICIIDKNCKHTSIYILCRVNALIFVFYSNTNNNWSNTGALFCK